MTLRDADILDLPDAPDFISKPPVYPLPEFIAMCEKLLPYWNARRFAAPPPLPVGEPFKLFDDIPAERNAAAPDSEKLLPSA